MEISNETLLQLLQAAISPATKTPKPGFFETGKCYFVRSVTCYYTGRCVSWDGQLLILDDAAWIADTGRFADALKSHTFSEVEPYPGRIAIGGGAIVDASEWAGELPREQK